VKKTVSIFVTTFPLARRLSQVHIGAGFMSNRGDVMAEVYVGQIMLTGFNFAPRGFAACNGQLLPINQNAALFSLLGVNYGGNGTTNFALPDLRGRTPAGFGSSVDPAWQPSPYTIGMTGGVENVTLLQSNMPQHTHNAAATTQAANEKNPANNIYGSTANEALYGPSSGTLVPLDAAQISSVGGNGQHANMQPFRVINFNIALIGIYPSRG
jgi:microcystin-dependent protein